MLVEGRGRSEDDNRQAGWMMSSDQGKGEAARERTTLH